MIQHILIANRGDVALRIAQAAADMGLQSTDVFAADEAAAAHGSGATYTVSVGAAGPAAYLDINRLVALARNAGCDAVHPGYGFLSERADFAQACADAGLIFTGLTAAQLAALRDKASALALARECGVPVLAGSTQAVSLPEAQAFMAALGGVGGVGVMLKAVGGGGGRHRRPAPGASGAGRVGPLADDGRGLAVDAQRLRPIPRLSRLGRRGGRIQRQVHGQPVRAARRLLRHATQPHSQQLTQLLPGRRALAVHEVAVDAGRGLSLIGVVELTHLFRLGRSTKGPVQY